MRVDRETFLLLAFSMWGCNGGAGKEAVVAVVDIPPLPKASERPDAAAVVDDAPKNRAPSVLDDDTAASDVPEPTDEAGLAADVSGDECGRAPASASARATSASCDDRGAAPSSCAGMRRCATGDFPFSRERCADYRRYFKPKVAARAVRCMTSQPARAVCDACNLYRCGDEALKSACTDATADAPCHAILRACPAVSMTECRSYLSGMNTQGRTKMVQCMAQGCGYGIYSCSESL